MGRLYQAQLQVLGLIFDAIEISRHPSFRSEDHDAAEMKEHFRAFIPAVTKTNGFRDRANRLRRSREEIPSTRARLCGIAADVFIPLFAGRRRGILRIEADGHDVEIATRLQ